MPLLEFGFRICMRSLLPRTPFIALTTTATKDTREKIFEVLLMDGCHIVCESPDKANISYVVQYMGKNASLAEYFSWIANVKGCGSAATRTIIYTQTISPCNSLGRSIDDCFAKNCKIAFQLLVKRLASLVALMGCSGF